MHFVIVFLYNKIIKTYYYNTKKLSVMLHFM